MPEYYSIADDGMEQQSQPIPLTNNAVFIVVDDIKRIIFIYKGNESPVRQKFVSARTASKIRQAKGMVYKVISVDQGEEPAEFTELIGGGPSSPVARPQVSAPSPAAPTPAARPATSGGPVPSARPGGTPVSSARPAPTEVRSPPPSQTQAASMPAGRPVAMPTPSSPSTFSPAPSSTPTPSSQQPVRAALQPVISSQKPAKEIAVTGEASQDKINDVIERIRSLDDPEGLVREIVIIGDRVFSCTKEFHKLFKKEVLRLDPMPDLPDGAFPASDYYTRLYIDHGKVLFTELFSELPRAERDEFLAEVRSSLRDLTKLGI